MENFLIKKNGVDWFSVMNKNDGPFLLLNLMIIITIDFETRWWYLNWVNIIGEKL